jgi:chromosome segregation ATPase
LSTVEQQFSTSKSTFESELSDLNFRLNSSLKLNDDFDLLTHKNSVLKEEVHHLQHSMKEMRTNNINVENENQQLKTELDTIQTEYSQLKQVHDDLIHTSDEQTSFLQQTINERNSMEQQLQNITKQMNELVNKIFIIFF